MRKVVTLAFMVILPALAMFSTVKAEELELSIYEIQHNADANGVSIYDSCDVNCNGGIVIHKYRRGRVKLTIQDMSDPNALSGWGGIIVKNNKYTVEPNVFDDVNVGDLVSFTKVIVIEDYGNTMLQFEPNSSFIIKSSDNFLPEPIVLSPNDIAAPVYQSGPPERWFVSDHNAEKYEGMLVKVIDVNVWDTGYGKAYDNYILQSNIDANLTCWASDYMNEDINGIYHPYVEIGQKFCGVTGIIEQYMSEKDGIYYDYYQLLTTTTADFTREQYCDLNDDCVVDFVDFALFAYYWQCSEPDWCGGADFTQDECVDIFDLEKFSEHWLAGKY